MAHLFLSRKTARVSKITSKTVYGPGFLVTFEFEDRRFDVIVCPAPGKVGDLRSMR